MTTWSKTPPSEPGWYWCLCKPSPGDAKKNATEEALYTGGGGSPSERLEWGPRIPSPEAVEAAKDALIAAGLLLANHGMHETAERCRAALAKLGGA